MCSSQGLEPVKERASRKTRSVFSELASPQAGEAGAIREADTRTSFRPHH